MMDDVVGLVMVQVISNIGETSDSFSAVTVVRPLAVSFGLAIAVPLACRLVAKPLTTWLNGARKSCPNGALNKLCQGTHTAFIIHTLVLTTLVTGATYAGTSNLFAAYLAGASISWWDSEVPHLDSAKVGCSPESPSSPVEHGTSAGGTGSPNPSLRDEVGPITEGEAAEGTMIPKEQSDTITNSGISVYHRYYATAVQRILQPFFFVGHFPILRLFFKAKPNQRPRLVSLFQLQTCSAARSSGEALSIQSSCSSQNSSRVYGLFAWMFL